MTTRFRDVYCHCGTAAGGQICIRGVPSFTPWLYLAQAGSNPHREPRPLRSYRILISPRAPTLAASDGEIPLFLLKFPSRNIPFLLKVLLQISLWITTETITLIRRFYFSIPPPRPKLPLFLIQTDKSTSCQLLTCLITQLVIGRSIT